MKKVIKDALYQLCKGMIPLVTTFLGVVLGSIFSSDTSITTAFVSGAVGTAIYNLV